MTHSSPESNGNRKEKIKVGKREALTPEKLRSRREQREQREQLKKKIELATKKMQEGVLDELDEFGRFKVSNEEKRVVAEITAFQHEILSEERDVVDNVVTTKNMFNEAMDSYASPAEYLRAISDGTFPAEITEKVASSAQAEKVALEGGEDIDTSYIDMAEGRPYTKNLLHKDTNTIEFTVEPTEGYKIIKQGDQLRDSLYDVTGKGKERVIINNFTEEEQLSKKAEWLASRVDEVQKTIVRPQGGTPIYPSSIDIDLSDIERKAESNEKVGIDLDKMEKDAQVAVAAQIEATSARLEKEAEAKKKKAEWEINGPIPNWGEDEGFLRPVNGDVEPIKELIGDLSKSESVATDLVETTEKKRVMTEEERNAQIEIWKKSLESTKVAIENAEKALLARKEKNQENLKALGLTNIEKGLAAWKKVRPGYKMALGLALGASGLGAVSVGLSALTFTEKGYREKREALEKEGTLENKYWTLTKSAGIGVLLALGTSQLSHLVGEAVQEHASSVIDRIKDFFSSAEAVAPPSSALISGDAVVAQPVSVEPQDLTPQTAFIQAEDISDTDGISLDSPDTTHNAFVQADNIPDVITPDAQIPEYITPGITMDTTSPINLDQAYTMKPGDDMNSILQRVLATVDDSKYMTGDQKAALINKFTTEWSTPISGASTPNWAIKEMLGGANGTEVHHLDHVRNAFTTLIERAKN
jgi:hypothetical protein